MARPSRRDRSNSTWQRSSPEAVVLEAAGQSRKRTIEQDDEHHPNAFDNRFAGKSNCEENHQSNAADADIARDDASLSRQGTKRRSGNFAPRKRYFDRLYQFLLVVTSGRDDEAQEALQQTLLRVVKYVRAQESEEMFWSWLKAVARSAAGRRTEAAALRRRCWKDLRRCGETTRRMRAPGRRNGCGKSLRKAWKDSAPKTAG